MGNSREDLRSGTAAAAEGGLKTPRTTVHRIPERGRYDRALVHEILDQGLMAHVAFAVDGQPFAIPMAYGRDGDLVYLHGSAASRLVRSLDGGLPCCVTVTHLDGLVLSRSAFHSSMNYRSVVILGRASAVGDPEEKLRGLERLTEHLAPGRWRELRPPKEIELKATVLLRLPIEEASAKVRTGPPKEDPDDLPSTTWAGVLPFRWETGAPRADSHVPAGTSPSPSVLAWRRPGGDGRV